MMKKLTALFLLIVATVLPASAEFRWGPAVGTDVASYFWKQKLVDTHYGFGFNAGVMGEIMIPGIGFGIDFGVRYNRHQAKVNFGERPMWAADGLGNETLTVQAIQIPVDLRFKWTRLDGLERIVAPFAYAGPVFSFTISNSCKQAVEHPTGNVAIQVGAGAELWEHFQVSAGYYWGVSYELRTIKLDNFSARAQGWNINIAYLF